MARAMVNCPNCENQAPIDSKWDRFICPHCGKQYKITVIKKTGQIELRPPSLKNARSLAEFAGRNTTGISDKTRNTLQMLFALFVGLSVIVLLSAKELGCFRSFSFTPSSPSPSPVQAQRSYAEMVATLDGSGNVTRYQSLLQQLSASFKVSEKTIADQTAGTVQTLRDSGIEESFLNIMEGISTISYSIKGTYMDTVTAYTALRIQGNSHSAAISSIAAMWNELMKLKK